MQAGLPTVRMIRSPPSAPMGAAIARSPLNPTIPEIGICLDFLNHLAISKDGDVSICVRFDPKHLGVLGNIKECSLEDLWNSPLRLKWKKAHMEGRRKDIPLCSYCQFWGVPTGFDPVLETDQNK